MKRILSTITALALCVCAFAGSYDKTLRLDYIFSGTDKTAEISLARMHSIDGWFGRSVNMDKLLLRGNGQIRLNDKATGKLLYVNSFSTLFQEWQNEEEATRVRKSFENVFLVPMPEAPATVTVELTDNYNKVVASITHDVDPADILISPVEEAYPSRYLLKSGASEDCIDIAFVAEGYRAEEAELFFSEAKMAMESILSHEPFKSMKDRFNFVAVAAPSLESGTSVPHDHAWKNTVLGSHYDTFYMERYLTTLNLFKLHDVLSSVPYEHIIILCNTETYGGGGIFNSYMLSSTRHSLSKPVIVHEFGHSFAGLADEYFYDDEFVQTYNNVVEPWEPNITTLVDFGSKWKDMMEIDGIVTKADQAAERAAGRDTRKMDYTKADFKVGLYEGAGYMSEGAYRPYPECRMKINEYPVFCPVCERAIRTIIDYYTVEDR
ncbi:MAG: M64 family metallopeptidase [Candidatus Cryptobacteroides sp.]